jgi:Tat protein translocase TatB subunit
MFGISFLELTVIGVIALIVFGPEKLPEMARTLGRITGELKKNADGIKREFYNSVYKPADEIHSRLAREARDLVSSKHISLPSESEHPGTANGQDEKEHGRTDDESSRDSEPKQ